MEMNSILTELRLLKLSHFKQLLHDRMWGLYNHLLAQFSVDRFQILHAFGKYIEDMYVKISISSLFYPIFSATLVELAKSIPVHSLPLFLFPFTVPCRIVFAKPEDLETWPNHLSFRFLTRVRSSLYSPIAAWIFLRTSSLVTWSLYEMFKSIR